MFRRATITAAAIGLLLSPIAFSRARAAEIDPQPYLDRSLVDAKLPLAEVAAYCQQRLQPIPRFEKADEWTKYADRVRQRVLNEVVFRGEAAEWRKAKSKIEWLGEVKAGQGYRIKKVRYEALPGMWIPALLYEPEKLSDQVPVFLNVNGHDANGKAAIYKQCRCINQAKRGILSLNVEWFGMGQLRVEGNSHARMNQLDLCGTSGVAPFFLAMQRGIDLLLAHPHADPQRVGVAGLSGGGWQTIFISSLDTRVTLCNPVAGYSSFQTRTEFASDLGDSEQTPVDLGATADYSLLTAMLAPRAALLTFNATDNCCFAAGHALPPLLAAAQPVYHLFGKDNELRSHVNHVPGNHNFAQENREALYRAIGDTFFPGEAAYERHEIDCVDEIKTAEDLQVPLPQANETFHTLALRLADRPSSASAEPTDARKQLAQVVRAKHWDVKGEVEHQESKHGVEITHWRLRVGDRWTVPAVEFAPAKPERTVLLVAEAGRKSLAGEVTRHLQANCRVVALDPFYWGESKIASRDYLWALMVSTVGDRPLGVQASQLSAIARWSAQQFKSSPITLVGIGPRASLAALVAAGLESEAIQNVETVGGLESLKQVLSDDLTVATHPEYFCFGLLDQFDIPQLVALVGNQRLTRRK